jgi:hypothetical protein
LHFILRAYHDINFYVRGDFEGYGDMGLEYIKATHI